MNYNIIYEDFWRLDFYKQLNTKLTNGITKFSMPKSLQSLNLGNQEKSVQSIPPSKSLNYIC
ncbi:hypothetical protein A5893_03975 [Pedobacter psychrophilus]|uniref:Uncharacterized protein n=1 Tax=Pedobacter psychrophilus TaxID=1826909 RepID=A0A179DN20_9SPHI|nr:hypothetical protein A5893_03975 [Pedobacter psychrophilus]